MPMIVEPNVEQQIDELIDDLTKDFGPKLGSDRVQELVTRVYRGFSGARITAFVPLLTRKRVLMLLHKLEAD